MGVYIPEDYALCRLRWQCAGDPEAIVTTFGVSPALGDTPTQIAAVIHDQALLTVFVANQCDSSYTLLQTSITVRRDGELFEGLAGTPVAGTASGAPLPVNCAVLVRKHTASGGRKNRGRMYVPGYALAEGNVSAAGAIDGAAVSSLTTKWQNYLSGLVAATYPMVILHSDPLDAPTAVTGLSVDGKVATQRRRLR